MVFVFDQFVCGVEENPPLTVNQVKVVQERTPRPVASTKNQPAVRKSRARVPRKLVEYAAWGRDPFAGAFRLSEHKGPHRDSSGLRLRGIIWKNGQARVLIGDVILRKGERLGDLQILDIKKDRVICKKHGKILTLVLH